MIAQIMSCMYFFLNDNRNFGVLRCVWLDSSEFFRVRYRDDVVPAIFLGMFVSGRHIEIKAIADPGSLFLGDQLEVNAMSNAPVSVLNKLTQLRMLLQAPFRCVCRAITLRPR